MSTELAELATMAPAYRAQAILKTSDLAPKLIALASESKHITVITNNAGRDQAHQARMVLKNQRIAMEKQGKAARDDANAFAKAVIAEECRLIDIIKPEETRLESLQGAYDAKIEKEKDAKRKRLQAIIDDAREAIQWFRDQPAEVMGKSSIEIAEALRIVEATSVTELPEQFVREAEAAKTLAISKLDDIYAARKGLEIEQAELQEQKEELDRKAKIAEDERAELAGIAGVITDCIGRDSAYIKRAFDQFHGDPPVDPSPAVVFAYAEAMDRLAELFKQAEASEAVAEAERIDRLERQRIEDEERAKHIEAEDEARRESARIDCHKRRIDGIRYLAREAVGKSSDAIAQLLTDLETTPADFAEFTADAVCAQDETRIELRRLFGEAEERERKDAEFRQRADEDAKRKAQAAADERAEAERKAKEAADLETAETQRTVTTCTLSEAAGVALSYLQSIGHGECLGAQMLASALERAA